MSTRRHFSIFRQAHAFWYPVPRLVSTAVIIPSMQLVMWQETVTINTTDTVKATNSDDDGSVN